MRRKKKSEIEISPVLEDFKKGRLFIEDELTKRKVSKELIQENVLVFEELFLRIIDQKVADSNITIWIKERISETRVMVDFGGRRFNINYDDVDEFNPGAIILSKYEEKIGYAYRSNENSIGIIARRTQDRMWIWSLIAVATAIVTYSILACTLDAGQQDFVCVNVVYRIEMLFGNAMIMISSPVTFFSLVTNVTDVYVKADRGRSLGSFFVRILKASSIAILVALLIYYVTRPLMNSIYQQAGMNEFENNSANFYSTFRGYFLNMVPDNIFDIFITISPFPLVLIAFITSAAICSSNRHFDGIKSLNDNINAFFSRILYIIAMFMPIAAYLAILDSLLTSGFNTLFFIAILILFVLIGSALVMAIYLIPVARAGINPIEFVRTCMPLFIENFKINSSIDAVPFNTRFCNRHFGTDIKLLDKELPVLAQISQSGNSYMITLFSLMFMSFTGATLSITTVVMLAILVFILSIGAPGQPGSILIGLIIVFSFAGISFELMCVAIYIEVFFGRLLPLMNVFGDITSVVVYSHEKVKKENKK